MGADEQGICSQQLRARRIVVGVIQADEGVAQEWS